MAGASTEKPHSPFFADRTKKPHANRCNSYKSLKLINATLDLMIFIGIPQPVGRYLCFTIEFLQRSFLGRLPCMKHPGTSYILFFVHCLKAYQQFAPENRRMSVFRFRVSQTKTFTTNIPSQVSQVGTYTYIPIDHRTPAQGRKKNHAPVRSETHSCSVRKKDSQNLRSEFWRTKCWSTTISYDL